MYALVDCNNFYCSCERVFKPQLINKPVVVLSNNDGCIISISDEAKKFDIVEYLENLGFHRPRIMLSRFFSFLPKILSRLCKYFLFTSPP